MVKPRIYHDFQNADPQGRLRLICAGTLEDLNRQSIDLREGLQLIVYGDDVHENGQLDELIADAIATYSDAESCWVATIDWNAIRHSSDESPNGSSGQSRRKNKLRPV